MSTGPAARTLALLRRGGYLAQIVERWIPHTRRRLDLFGFVDIVALDGRPGVLGIQVTSTPNMSARLNKIRTECADAARLWLEAGNRIEVHGWGKRGKAGKRKLWTLKVCPIGLADLPGAQLGVSG